MRPFQLILVLIAGLLAWDSPVSAEDCDGWCLMEQAKALDAEGKTQAASQKWLEAAQAGEGFAFEEIGRRYAEGEGVRQDKAEAARWYLKAAREVGGEEPLARYSEIVLDGQRPADPMACIGDCESYADNGWAGQAFFPQRAFENFKEGARRGSASAMQGLAYFYANGRDVVEPDQSLAAAWAYTAATRGNSTAMLHLGTFFGGVGKVLKPDAYLSSKWLVRALAKGEMRAKEVIDRYRDFWGANDWNLAEPNLALGNSCLRHPSLSANLAQVFEKEAGSPIEGELELIENWQGEYNFLHTHAENLSYAEYLHAGIGRCELIDLENNREVNRNLVRSGYANLEQAAAVVRIAIRYNPTEEVYWVDLARLTQWSNQRVSAEAWSRFWSLLGIRPPSERAERLQKLQDEFHFRVTNDVLREIAMMNMLVGDFQNAYDFASLIFSGDFPGPRDEEMDWLILAIGFANGGIKGLEQARDLVDQHHLEKGSASAWRRRLESERRFADDSAGFWCDDGQHGPNVQSITLVEAMERLVDLALGEHINVAPGPGQFVENTSSLYVRYELVQVLKWANQFRRDDLYYNESYSCDPERRAREREYGGLEQIAADLVARMPVRKLSRVGELMMADAESLLAQGELNKAANVYYRVLSEIEPWYAPAYFNRAIVAVADGGLNEFEIDHMRTYLDLAPDGPMADEAHKLLAKWVPVLEAAEKEGRCPEGAICPDREVIEYEK